MNTYTLYANKNSMTNAIYPALYPLLAIFVSRLITHPIYVVITRLQMSSRKWSWQIIYTMIREEGIMSFYRGFTANIVKSILLSVVQDTLTEKFSNHVTYQISFQKKVNSMYVFDAISILSCISLFFRY